MFDCNFKLGIFTKSIPLIMKFLKARNLSDILAGILTFLTFVMALLASVSPYVHPQNFSLGSIAGMTLPFILILSLFLFFTG